MARLIFVVALVSGPPALGLLVREPEPSEEGFCSIPIETGALDALAPSTQVAANSTSFRPFFLKAHKVGGTTVMVALNAFVDQHPRCTQCCGQTVCQGQPLGCTGHKSLVVMAELLRHFEPRLQLESDPTEPQNLLPYEERHALLSSVTGKAEEYTSWIPSSPESEGRVLILTVLRDPRERLRSKYYFNREMKSCPPSHCAAKNMTFLEWMQMDKVAGLKSGRSLESCCEYTSMLGGSTEKAKNVLATFFDVVGITETMDEFLVTAARAMGKPPSQLPDPSSPEFTERDNSDNKEPWTEEERRAAEELVSDDLEVYQFAQDLSTRRILQMWDSQEKLEEAVQGYRRGDESSASALSFTLL
eukprot:CAMPEP_0170594066 /NCGR_PEP_ID=MMETSP0224-20130122/13795_1 /TAXON_ID=285029 /ORGANISM="Togula jolla, Strain CCCM 725" /LENGTH=359 /DNA_ID=CAMNT_0010918085 /DNA_START=18 /DNA_END=1098 /DNA_ORIENTATION=+